jgi:hypothetical protein
MQLILKSAIIFNRLHPPILNRAIRRVIYRSISDTWPQKPCYMVLLSVASAFAASYSSQATGPLRDCANAGLNAVWAVAAWI